MLAGRGPQPPYHHRHRRTSGGGTGPCTDIQDRDGAPGLLASIRYLFPWLRHVFADGGYAGDKLTTALAQHGDWRIEIVKRSDQVTGFRLLPRRWVVERTFAWLNRNRRLAKDFEATIGSSQAWSTLFRSNCLHAASLGLQLIAIMRTPGTIFPIPSQALKGWKNTVRPSRPRFAGRLRACPGEGRE
jgi:transposase